MCRLMFSRTKSRGLFSSKNEPVWPVVTESDLQLMDQLSTQFSIELVELDEISLSTETTPLVKFDGEFVACVGDELAPLARLYAHLTGRSLRQCCDFDDVLKLSPQPAIVICLDDHVSPSFLRNLYGKVESVAPGLISVSYTHLTLPTILRV